MPWDHERLHRLLRTRRFGREFVYLEETDSTNRWLLANENQFHLQGATVVANHQTSGRGRYGREWEDVPGKSLLFSVLLRPTRESSPLGFLSLMAGVAVAHAIMKTCGCSADRLQLKWPNDVLIDEKKVCGILSEGLSGEHEARVAIGVGINLWQEEHELPREMRFPASSLHLLLQKPFSREELLAEILVELESLYDLFQEHRMDEIRKQWLALAAAPGTVMSVETPDGAAPGTFEGIGSGGQLLLKETGGILREIYSGEII
jgi:BirA family biotin operon repressor/biotin-[acetyl-CoA-carboxylase] ligase